MDWNKHLEPNIIDWTNTKKNRFLKGNVDSDLYLRKDDKVLLIVLVFVDDIIFRGNDDASKVFLEWIKK